jgi:hypothetical protein
MLRRQKLCRSSALCRDVLAFFPHPSWCDAYGLVLFGGDVIIRRTGWVETSGSEGPKKDVDGLGFQAEAHDSASVERLRRSFSAARNALGELGVWMRSEDG